MNSSIPHPCKIAVAGAGAMAREHIRAFMDVPGVEVAGIFNRTRSRAEALANEFGIPVVCDSIGELYEKTHADLVVIAVWEVAANAVAKACFEFPWQVLMEKPPGLDLADANDIHATAVERDRYVMVGLNRQFLSSTQAVMADLQNSSAPRLIQVQDQQDLAVAASFGYPDALLENWMYANSIHLVDYFRLFGRGRVNEVIPVIRWDSSSPRMVAAKIDFESGDIGLYTAIWNGPGPWTVSISTPEKRWELRPLEQAGFQTREVRSLQMVEVTQWDRDFKPGFRLQAENAIAAVRGHTSSSPTLEDSLKTMELIKAIYTL